MVFAANASLPTATLFPPEVAAVSAFVPTATLSALILVRLSKAVLPKATLSVPVG